MNESMPRSGDASGGTKQQIRDTAANLAQGAKEQARAQYDERKGAAVGELGTLASSLRRVVDELGQSNPNNMSGKVVATLADRLESFSRSLDGKDLDRVVTDVERFARRNPAAFLGGAVALGFIASRFLKSSAGPRDDFDFYASEGFGVTGRTDTPYASGGFGGGVPSSGGLYGSGGLSGSGTGSDVALGGMNAGGMNTGGMNTGGMNTGGMNTGGTNPIGTRSENRTSSTGSLDSPSDLGTITSATDKGRTGNR
jgi:hypothetical protein